jgi:glycerophosphoryl diester phosphodiesterase
MTRGLTRASALLVGASSLMGCAPDGLGRSNPNFLVVGHHGAPNLAPENTIPSFEVATVLGANGIELDFCITKDGTLVALHDCNPDDPIALARQTGREGFNWLPDVPTLGSPWRKPSNELTLDELRQYYGYRRFDGLRDPTAVIPTLAEVVAWLVTEPRIKAIYLDLKFGPTEQAPARQALREVWAAWQANPNLQSVRFYFLNVHREIVDVLIDEQQVDAADPLRVVWDYEGPGALGATLGAGLRDISVGLTPTFAWSDYRQEIADMVDSRERKEIDSVLAWTFDRERQLAELLYYSVDGIITNDVSTLHRMWQETLE